MELSIYQFWLIQYYSIKDNGDQNQLFDQVKETVEWIWFKIGIGVAETISSLIFERQPHEANLWDVKDLYLVWLERFIDIHKSINGTYIKHAHMYYLSLIILSYMHFKFLMVKFYKILVQFFIYSLETFCWLSGLNCSSNKISFLGPKWTKNCL